MTRMSTLDRLIEQLTFLRTLYSGDTEVVVMQYDGGNDAPCYVLPAHIKDYREDCGKIMLHTHFI
jgi:hypothetical protein